MKVPPLELKFPYQELQVELDVAYGTTLKSEDVAVVINVTKSYHS